ncbi:MAG: HD family phosphohydrolase [Candidatus Paceibacterota bacterium]
MKNNKKIEALESLLVKLYEEHKEKLLFHGWSHIEFVRAKALEFAPELNADLFLVESAALVHDLDYIDKEGKRKGENLRKKILSNAGYGDEEKERIEEIVHNAHIGNQKEGMSNESKALADGDNLFKVLPFTPIFFAHKYIEEQDTDIKELMEKILDDQQEKIENGTFFYSNTARQKYLHWAETNIGIWINMKECFDDPDIVKLISSIS